MARPALVDIDHGQASADAAVNDNFAILVDGPIPLYQAATVTALLAVNAANYENCLAVTADTDELWQSDGANWVHYGPGHVNLNGARGLLKVATTLLATGSGATQTWSGAFPAGSIRLGVAGRVTTAITGATSVDIGDGTDADLYANDLAVALNTTFTPANHTATPLAWAAAAGDVVATANGSNFTAGAIRLVAYYLQLTAPTS
jgi:hypothetical protein